MIQSARVRPSLALTTHRRLIPHLMAGLSAVALTLAAPEARADDILWTGGNGEFTTGSNWAGGVVPSGSDAGVFGDVLARTVTITVAPAVTTGTGDLKFNAGAGQVTFNLGSGAGSVFQIVGRVTTDAAGTAPIFNVQAGGTELAFRSGTASAGNFTINNQGTVSFNGTSSAGAATINTTNGGLLTFDGNSDGGSAALNATNSTIQFNASSAANATITLNGTSALRFTGAGADAGAATITANSGSLVAFTGFSFGGTGSLDIKSGATLEMQNSSNPNLSFGSLAANGTVNIGNKNLTVGSLSGSGTIIGNVGGGVAPVVTVGGDNSSTSFSGAFTGQVGVLAKVGTGTFTFSGTLPTIGAINVGGGTFAWVGAPGAVAGLTVNAGVLDISGLTSDPTVRQFGGNGGVLNLGARSLIIDNDSTGGTSLFRGVIQGTGGLTIGGDTFAILTGANTYTGATTITNPDPSNGLYLQDGGSIADSSKVNLTASGARLYLSATTSGTSIRSLEGVTGSAVDLGTKTLNITNGWSSYAVDISGSGGLTVTGGSQVLTGTTSYSGATAVTGGTLQVDGSIAASSGVTVGSGGTLAGAGTVSGLTVASGGFVAPGSGGIGTLNVTGNATLSAGSTTVIEVSAASADKLAISGTASLAGGLRLVTVGTGFSFGTTYTILSATGGLTGTFNPVNIVGSFGPGIGTSLSYTGTDAILSLSANALLPLLPTGIAANPRNVAGGIDQAVGGGADASAFFGLYALSPSAMPGALSALSGETATATQQTAFNAAGLFLSMMLDPMTGARGATAGSASPSLVQMADPPVGGRAVAVDAGWSVWTKAYAQSGRANGEAGTGAASSTGSLYGVAAGADKRLTPDTVVGFALSGGGTSFGLGQARGSGTGDTFQAGLYGSTRLGDGYLSAALAYGWNSFSVSRTVAAAGLNETYASRVTAQTYGGRLEAGWRMGVRAYGLTPYAALEAIGYQAPGYAETFTAPTTGAAALAYGAKSSASIRTELGLRADARTDIAPGQTLITYGRLAWAYQARPDRSVDASFQGLANSGFTVFGARASTHTALASLGAELQIAAGTRLSSSIDAELGDRHRSIRANLGLRHSW